MILSYDVWCLVWDGEEVVRMEGDDDFYVAFEDYLDDDEISPEEEGFMRGFTEELFGEE